MLRNWIISYIILKRLLSYVASYFYIFLIGLLMLMLSAVSEVINPMLVSYFIDHILSKKSLTFFILFFVVFIFFILIFLSAFFRYLQTILFNYVSISIVQEIRTELMYSILNKPLRMFNIKPIGEFISIITNDTEIIKDFYMVVISTTLRNILIVVTILIAMFWLNWRLAFITLFLFPIVSVISFLYQYFSTGIIHKLRRYVANINIYFNDVIKGISIIQQFSKQKYFANKLCKISFNYFTIRVAILRLEGYLLRPLISFIFVFTLCEILLYFSLYFNKKIIGVGVLYAFISYLNRLNEPLVEIISKQSVIQQVVVSGSRIFSLIDNINQKYGDNDQLFVNKISLFFKNVSFINCHNKLILENISFFIPSNCFFALVGNTGSGKSTIVNLIMKYYSATNGTIFLNECSIELLSKRILRKTIAVVPQEPIIMTESVYNNITLGKNINEFKVWDVLKKVSLYSLVKSLPNKLQSNLGEQGYILSAGQKQLLSFARVLIHIPSILILDNATSNIDYNTEKIIINIINNIKHNTTILFVTHRLSSVVNADQILLLKNGKIIEKGNHNFLLKIKGYYYKLFLYQNK